jgi:hypothetical protein
MVSSQGGRRESLEIRRGVSKRATEGEHPVPLLPVMVPKIKKGKNLTPAVLPREFSAHPRPAWAERMANSQCEKEHT